MSQMEYLAKFKVAIFSIARIVIVAAVLLQVNSPTNNSPTNRFPQPPQGPRIFGEGNWDAMDCADCDAIYDEKITRLTNTRDNAINAALEKYKKQQKMPLNPTKMPLHWKTQFSTAIWLRPTSIFWTLFEANAPGGR